MSRVDIAELARLREERGLTLGQIAQRLWAIVRAAGNTEPVLLCEAPDTLGAASLADRLHYGTLQNTDFFDRRSPGKTRIELRVQEML